MPRNACTVYLRRKGYVDVSPLCRIKIRDGSTALARGGYSESAIVRLRKLSLAWTALYLAA